jgi:hypothetical protein
MNMKTKSSFRPGAALSRTALLVALLAAFQLAARAQTAPLRITGQVGATNVNGIAHSALGGRAGLRLFLPLGRRLAFTSDLTFALWRDHVRQESIYGTNRYNHTFKRAELSPGVEVAVTGRVSIGAGAYLGCLLRAKERIREFTPAGALTVDYTRNTTGLFFLPDAGLTLRLDLQLHADWRVGLMLSQGVVNTSVLYDYGIKAVPQGILLGLEYALPVGD